MLVSWNTMPTSIPKENGSVADIQFESPVIIVDPAAACGSVTLTDESSMTKASVRAADDTAAASALGLAFGSAEHRGDVFVARIRPDEWMVFGAADMVVAMIAELDLGGYASTVDITHSRLMFRVTGGEAAKVMEKVCSLDFSDHMAPNGSCAGASVAKVGCDVIRDDIVGADGATIRSYRILCDRSFGQYLFDALVDAKAEFG